MKKTIKKIIKTLPFSDQLVSLYELPSVRKIRNRVFKDTHYYCRVLSGEASYDLCINSDLTVSCNCQDWDGSGHIGDLNKQTLKEIFDGKVASRFRRQLAKGQFPVPTCHQCVELQKVSKKEAYRQCKNYSTKPKNIMVENTVLCNYKCRHCYRDKILNVRKKLKMSLEDIEKVAMTLRDNQIATVYFYNLGEPFLSKSVYEEISILKSHNPDLEIWISTNGSFLTAPEKKEAALLVDHIFFSIDGPSQEIVEKYQVGADFNKSYNNMKDLVSLRNTRQASKPVIEWKYVVFNWNDDIEQIQKAIELAKAASVDVISFLQGGGLPSEISTKFLNDPFFQQLGTASWRGREVDLRGI